ncbi:DUF4192 domain-containing protein, partial [Intrasporangium oryzae]|uniref:DUF4192 domain-containing protein n=1 Tax=Intrasporangium oryzae TaxID=412687 RepID=UPI0012F8E53F
AIPYLLGFEPARSLVAVALKNGRLGLTSRIDLPDPGEPGRAARVLMPALRREGPDQVILIGYEDTPGHAAAVLEAFGAALQGAGIGLRDRLLVTGGRWRSLDCTDPGCCPPEGTPIGRSRAGLAVASEFVGQGIAPLPDPAALAALLEPTDQARLVRQLLSRPRRVPQPRVIGGLWARILDVHQDHGPDPADITVQDAAWAARTLRDVALRDGISGWLTPGTLELPELPKHVRGALTRLGPGFVARAAAAPTFDAHFKRGRDAAGDQDRQAESRRCPGSRRTWPPATASRYDSPRRTSCRGRSAVAFFVIPTDWELSCAGYRP